MKNLWKSIKSLITLLVLFVFVWYFIKNRDDFLIVLSADKLSSALILILYSLSFLINGFFIKVILKSFDRKLPTFESFYISIISSLGNYFLPMRGGAVIRSVYLKKKFNFPYSHFVATLYGNYIIVFLVNSFLALLSLLLIQFSLGVVSVPLYLFFGLLFTSMLFLSFFKFPLEKIKEFKIKFFDRIAKILKNIFDGWNLIVANKRLLFSLMFLTLINFLISTILFLFEFKSLGISSKLINVVLYNCLSGVSLLVSLTPGSLGIREAMFLITSNLLGVTNDQVMQLALLDRGLVVITLVFWFIILGVYEKVAKKKR